MVLGRAFERRRPWPFHVRFNDIPYLLGESKEGAGLISSRPPVFQSQPTSFEYGSQNPVVEVPQNYSDLSGGWGLKYQLSRTDRRYRIAHGLDASVANQLIPGPKRNFQTTAVNSENEGRAFFEIDGSLYLVASRYAYVRAEVQTLTESGSPTGGTFKLTYGSATSALAFNVSAADMQAALRLLTGLESVTVTRTGTTTDFVWTVVMRGAGEDPALMTLSDNSLTGGSSPTVTPATSVTIDAGTGFANVDQDFGSGKVARDALVVRHETSDTSYALIALGDASGDYIYRFDGTTYTQHTSLQAICFATTASELWRAFDTNQVGKCDLQADWWNDLNWTGQNAFVIGDKTSAITGMAVSSIGQLLVFKTDGVYSLDPATGEQIHYFPFLKFATDPDNGRWWWSFENDIWVSYRDGTYKLSPDLTLTPIGPDLSNNDDLIAPRVTCGAGHGTLAVYAGVTDVNADDGYLFKWGGWQPDSAGQLQRIPAWHGTIQARLGNARYTAMYISTVGAASGHSRLYFAYQTVPHTTTVIGWIDLPCTANPLSCLAYKFTAGDYSANARTISLPVMSGGFVVDQKAFRAGTMIIPNASATYSARLEYTLSTTDPVFTLSGVTSGTVLGTFESKVGKTNFPSGTTAYVLSFGIKLLSSSATDPTVIYGFAVHYAIRADVFQQHDMLFLAGDGMVDRAGKRYRRTPEQVRSALLTVAVGAGDYTMIFPDGRSRQVAVVDYGESWAWDTLTGRIQQAMKITVAELAEMS